MNMPVYLFTGFLEGGKTTIIQESLADKRFNSGEKTLVILCEEGIEELDSTKFWGQNVYIRPKPPQPSGASKIVPSTLPSVEILVFPS